MSIRIGVVGDCASWNFSSEREVRIPLEIDQLLSDCDAFLLNLEGPILSEQTSSTGPYNSDVVERFLSVIGKKQPTVTSDPWILGELDFTQENIAFLANNHILDSGENGVVATKQHLRESGFQYVGAGTNKKEASKPIVRTVEGVEIGILNYNFIGWEFGSLFYDIFGASANAAGANYETVENINEQISKLRSQVNLIITSCHIGSELSSSLSKKHKRILEAIDADIILVHHPHTLVDTDISNVYPCGDFIFRNPSLPEKRKSRIYVFDIEDHEVFSVTSRELIIDNGLPNEKRTN
jgi:hypothetical protein